MWSVVLAVGMMLAGEAAPPCDAGCERREAERLLGDADSRAAVDRLKAARARYPEDRGLLLLLARAYLLQENLFWAERTIADGLRRWPDDPELRAWMAAVHLRQGDPELAEDDLEPELEPAEDPLRARWRLLAASRARLAGEEDDAFALVRVAAGGDALFAEDLPALVAMRSDLDPWWSPVLDGSLDLGGGHTSNALAGSPTDPGKGGPSSDLLVPELRLRVVPPVGGRVRPVIDVELLGSRFFDEDAEELSTLLGGLRLGGAVTGQKTRLTLGYRVEGLYLEEESGLYSEAHRGELELEWAGGSVLFGGFGHRSYSDDRRTRWEGDIGLGGSMGRVGGVPVLGGATVRLADAESQAYDQLGVSAAASATVPLGRRTSLRIAVSAAWDDYFNSGGPEGLLVFGTTDKRQDLLGRFGLTFWAPEWHHLRPGLEIRATRRDSTADELPGYDFSYDELRAVFWVRWTFTAGGGTPTTVTPAGHVPLEWGIEPGDSLQEERILDLLRRDEELRRGSSCTIRP